MVNKVTLIGRLGKDPELKTLPSGACYTRFSVATNDSYKDKQGEWQDQTEWHNIIVWRKSAESLVKRFKKGNLIYLEGKLTHQSWQDQEGNTKNMTEVNAHTYRKLEKSNGDYTPPPSEQQPSDNTGGDQSQNYNTELDDSTDDDLPF